jgi:hypothetical protein
MRRATGLALAAALAIAAAAPARATLAKEPPAECPQDGKAAAGATLAAGARMDHGGCPPALPGTAGPIDAAMAPPAPPRRGLGADRRPEPLVPVLETLALNATLLGIERYLVEVPWAQISPRSVWDNTHTAWVWDDDTFWVNQLGHPYQGSVPFTSARSAGFGFWGSSAFVFGASMLWEIAAETEPPSLNDQVTTFIGGVALGEALHRTALSLRANRRGWSDVLATVVDPFGALNRSVVGPPAPEPAAPSRWDFWAGVGGRTGVLDGSGSTSARTGVEFTYGVPGDPTLQLERPFDHFVLEGRIGATVPADATLRVRGLLAGSAFASPTVQGLWGLFASLDMDTPGQFRTSTVGLGLGASARADVGGGVALEGTTLLSAVPVGTAGKIPVAPGLASRDYVIGPGAQALLDVRAAWERVSAGLALRPLFLVGAESRQGDELMMDGRARVLVRVAGRHGVGVEGGRNLRYARDAAGTRTYAVGRLFQMFWALGGATPGAEP